MDELERILKNAILDSVRRWAATEPLKGYALLLDGDLQTVLGVWPSRGVLEEEGEHILFVPVDWDQEDHTPAFEKASLILSGVPGDDYESRARTASDAMVVALERAREEAPELRGVFLMVASVAGGNLWRRLEGESVRRLNGPELFERWRAGLG